MAETPNTHPIETKIVAKQKLDVSDLETAKIDALRQSVRGRSKEARDLLKKQIKEYREHADTADHAKSEIVHKTLSQIHEEADKQEASPAAPAAPVETAYSPDVKTAEEIAADAKGKNEGYFGMLSGLLESPTIASWVGSITSSFNKAQSKILKYIGPYINYTEGEAHSKMLEGAYFDWGFAKIEAKEEVRLRLPNSLRLVEGKNAQNDDDSITKLREEWTNAKTQKDFKEFVLQKTNQFLEQNKAKVDAIPAGKPRDINLAALVGKQKLS